MHFRHVEHGGAFEVPPELGRVGGLAHQVQLLRERRLEFQHNFPGPQPPGTGPIAFGQFRDGEKQFQIPADRLMDAGAQHLDDHLAAVVEPGGVNLSHGGGRQRGSLKLGERLVGRTPERFGEDAEHVFGGERRHLILQFRQLVRDGRWQQVATRRDGLSELHEDGPEFLQRDPDSCSQRLGTRLPRQ